MTDHPTTTQAHTTPSAPQARADQQSHSGEKQLRVAVAVDLRESLCRRIEELEPRIELIRDHSLYRPMRGPADWSGDPEHTRSAQEQEAFDTMVDSAEALFGIPDVDPDALARTVAQNPQLCWVHATAAGGGSQVKAAGLAREALDRIDFTTSAGVHGRTLTEFALFGLLAGAKGLPRLQEQQGRRHWSDRWEMKQLSQMAVLVVGLGGIGSEVAATVSALGATVIGTSRSGTPVPGVDRLIAVEDLPRTASTVDAVVNTLPGTAATEKLLGEEFFAAMSEEAIVVNVGRGTVIDEEALVEALDAGRVGFAALDVFAVEPLPESSPLWGHPRVLVSPHTAALNSGEEERIAQLFAENARRLLDGEELVNLVDTIEFY